VTYRAADYTPLIQRATKAEVTAFRRQVAARGGGRSTGEIVGLVFLWMVLGFFALVAMLVVFGFAVTAAVDGSPWLALLPLAVIAVIVVGVVLLVRRGTHQRWEHRLRLSRFADANGLLYSPGDPAPGYAGAIFGIGGSRQMSDHMRSSAGRFIDYGNYHYTTSNGKHQQRRDWGFLAIRLDRPLPHMMLDATANNGVFGSSLPRSFSRDQRLSLEGDFDRHFTLYCPSEYERDALYVFTPDLMVLLIDEAAAFDVEIVDDWLFVYSPRALDLSVPALHERMFRIISTVGAKTVTRTDRYVDARAQVATTTGGTAGPGPGPADGTPVAPPPIPFAVTSRGRRLRSASPAVLVVVIAVLALAGSLSVGVAIMVAFLG
jgi:hypothetical protein